MNSRLSRLGGEGPSIHHAEAGTRSARRLLAIVDLVRTWALRSAIPGSARRVIPLRYRPAGRVFPRLPPQKKSYIQGAGPPNSRANTGAAASSTNPNPTASQAERDPV